jgi:cytochrome c-type biogenesis protein CcmF
LLAICAFFFGIMVGPANPFAKTVGEIPTNGAGPNALLQNNPLVAIHPPLLYLGFVGCSVPFAFAIGMLITGRVNEDWLVATRKWMLFTWTALAVGIVLGAWWSYQVLGWGGFWAWDPVENAALMPWLVGTAYVHSVIVQERRGLFRVWNLSLAVAAFSLTVLATFLTRSGVIQSVHAFSSGTLGPILIAAFAFSVIVGFGLIAWRGDRMRAPVGIDAPFGREGAFVVNNVAFVGFTVVVLLGTVFPLFYEAMQHRQVTVGGQYFNLIAMPAAIFVLFVMALAPAMSWRSSSLAVLWKRLQVPAWSAVVLMAILVAFGVRGMLPIFGIGLGGFAFASAFRTLVLSARATRRQGGSWLRAISGPTAGGMVVHLGVVVLALGVTASSAFVQRTELALAPGQLRTFDGHSFRFLGYHQVADGVKTGTEAVIQIDGKGIFRPAVSTFIGREGQAVGTPAIDSSFRGDVYITFDAVGGTGESSGAQVIPNLAQGSVAIGIVVEPLIPWIWAGGLLVGVGGVLAAVPRRRPKISPKTLPEPESAPGDVMLVETS